METPIPALTEPEKAWLAAIIDGEGSIGIYRSRRPKTKTGWRFYPCVSFYNTNEALMDRFVELTSQWVTRRRKIVNGSSLTNKEVHVVEIRYGTTGDFLNTIKEYLIAKKGQADLVLRMLEVQRPVGHRNADLIPFFNSLYVESRRLNHKGTKVFDEESLALI